MRDLFGEAPANRSASWHPPPETRGSFNILISCLVTLGLCVWSAIHLNIPGQDRGPQRKWYDPRRIKAKHWRKVKWLVLALLAPEMVAFTAWRQRREAFRLTKLVEEKLYVNQEEIHQPLQADQDIESGLTDDAPGNTGQSFSRRHKWTHVHSFFVLAGGFTVDTSKLPEQEKYLPEIYNERVTLTTHGVYELIKYNPSLLPDISKEEIMDKSKANGLAKFIICAQVTWFMVQCIARLATPGCSISLLELSTFAHAACTLLIYGLWWDKPFDVEEPERIIDPRIHDFCAYCCFWSYSDHYYGISIPERNILVRTAQQYVPDVNITSSEAVNLALHVAYAEKRSNKHDKISRGKADLCIPGTIAQLKPKDNDKASDYLFSSPRDRERWNRAVCFSVIMSLDEELRGFTINERMEDLYEFYNLKDNTISISKSFSNFKNLYKDWRNKQLSGTDVFLFGFFLAGLSYGGLHILAWNAPFTSQTEHLLWKISCFVVAFSGPTLLLMSLGLMVLENMLEGEGTELLRHVLLFFVVPGIFLPCAVLYLLARVYLVVECFISFAYLPESTFNQPQWTAYFPHIQ